MGLCLSVDTAEEKQSRVIDEQLLHSAAEEGRLVRCLLLGPGEAGKSTVLKQMRLQNCGAFPPEEVAEWTGCVYDNLIENMKALCYATEELGYSNELHDDAESAWEVVINADRDQRKGCSQELYDALQLLWRDEIIQETWRERARFNIAESAAYFFDQIDRIREPGYRASGDDILRLKTRNFVVESLDMKARSAGASKVNTLEVINVGGQRTERKNWIHYFETVDLVIFIAALSEYNQLLAENDTENRMVDAIDEFDRTINSNAFFGRAVILFLNKVDLFREKVHVVPIESVAEFQDFNAADYDPNDVVESGKQYFKDKFLERDDAKSHRMIHTHFTCATDRKSMEKLIEEILSQEFRGHEHDDIGML